jgi:hypothetical protein
MAAMKIRRHACDSFHVQVYKRNQTGFLVPRAAHGHDLFV